MRTATYYLKGRLMRLCLALLCLLSVSHITHAQSWKAVGGSEANQLSMGGINGSTIAVDRYGTPYVAFADRVNGNSKLTVRKYVSGAWTTVGTVGFSSTAIYSSLSMVFDTFGNPYVAYLDNSLKANVVKYSGGSWSAVGSSPITSGTAYYQSLAIDGSGNLYLSFQDASTSNKLTVMKYSGSSWSALGGAGISTGNASQTSMAVDPSGTPYVLYTEGLSYGHTTVKKYSGGVWSTVGTAKFSLKGTFTPGLAINSSGTPYVVYQDSVSPYNVTVMSYTGGAWGVVGSAGFAAGEADYPTICINSSGTPYVLYSDNTNSDRTTCMTYNGSSWVGVGTAGFIATPGSIAQSPVLAISSTGTLYMTCGDNIFNNYKGSAMTYNGSAWVPLGSATGFSTGCANGWSNTIIGAYSPIAFNSGTPYIVYQDEYNSSKSTVTSFDGTNWNTVGTAGFSGGITYYNSIALDALGTPYVVYEDASHSNKATVKTYSGGVWSTVGTVGFSTGTATYTHIAVNSTGVPYVVYCDAGNSGKATVMRDSSGVWVKVGTGAVSTGTATMTKMAFDALDNPYIVFRDGSAVPAKATVMKYSGGAWTIVGGGGLSAGGCQYTSIAIDASNNIFVGYSDGTLSSKASVMEYTLGSWTQLGTAGFSAGSTTYDNIGLDASGTPYIAYKDASNNYRVTVMKYNSGSNTWAAVGSAGFTYATLPSTNITQCSVFFGINGSTPYAGYTNYMGWVSAYSCVAPTTPTVLATASTICNGGNTTLSIGSGSLNDATTWSWYGGSCGATLLGTGTSIILAPNVTTTYYVRGEGGCTTPGICTSQIINVNVRPTSAITSANTSVCNGGSTNITGTITAHGTWTVTLSNGSTGTGHGNGSFSISVSPTLATTYTVTSLVDSVCTATSGDLTGSTAVTISTTSTWTGAISTDWNQSFNWCGIVPTAGTNVYIPATATRMPVVIGVAHCHNLGIASGATVTASSGQMYVSGIINDTGTYVGNTSSTIILNGTTTQTLPTGFQAGGLNINNPAGVNVSGKVVITDSLILTAGVLTADSVIITSSLPAAVRGFTSDATVPGYSSGSYVKGLLKRKISGLGTYHFPIGDATNYQLITITTTGLVCTNSLVAKYTSGNGGCSTPVGDSIIVGGTKIRTLLDGGYWSITPDVEPTSGTYSAFINERGYTTYPGAASQMTLIKRSGCSATWKGLGTHLNNTQFFASNTAHAERTGLTSFSDFGMGWGDAPLPVTIESFTATAVNTKQVNTVWTVTSQHNNKLFNVQRSADGNTFTTIGTLNGCGTCHDTRTYNYTDVQPFMGTSYYRLQQVDNDGIFTYSALAPVTIQGTGISSVQVYPNPATGAFAIDIRTANTTENAIIRIENILGQTLEQQTAANTNGYIHTTLNTNTLALTPGVYIIHILLGTDSYMTKLVIQK